jgi:hypothetical protein
MKNLNKSGCLVTAITMDNEASSNAGVQSVIAQSIPSLLHFRFKCSLIVN